MTINGINYFNNPFMANYDIRSLNVDFTPIRPTLPTMDFPRIDWTNLSLNFFNKNLYKPNFYNFMSFSPNYTTSYTNGFNTQCFNWNNQSKTIFGFTVEQKPIVIGDSFVKTELPKVELPDLEIKPLSLQLVDKALSYKGIVNSDAEGNRLFSPNGKSQAWCADFVTFVVKDIYGNKLPRDFGSSAVSGIRDWGDKKDCYLTMPEQNKGNFIAQNIKPGDIMILKENGSSHTGIVTKVNEDGSFEAVEGNCDDAVNTMRYTANDYRLSGFVSLEKYA